MKILLVHGIGYQEEAAKNDGDDSWLEKWKTEIKKGLISTKIAPETDIYFESLAYDYIFRKQPELKISDVQKIVDEIISEIKRRMGKTREFGRDFSNLPDVIQSTVGMILHYINNPVLRSECNDVFGQAIKQVNPELIFTHSLGSMLAYDYFQSKKDKKGDSHRILVTFGSQLTHPKIQNIFAGKFNTLQNLKYWINLYNRLDLMMVESFEPILRTDKIKFEQMNCDFNEGIDEISIEGVIAAGINHSGHYYLKQDKSELYYRLKYQLISSKRREFNSIDALDISNIPKAHRKKRKALLIGINEYPDSRDTLDGCVNDSFLMSQVLQEFGFESSNIRMLLNSRATSNAIFERLEWLLEDAKEGDERVFYYSGHGTQIPARNFNYELDHLLESLVPYNFDFDDPYETGVIDKKLSKLYSNLDYGINFNIILDCCHSGGMDKAGSGKVKSIRLPDDIRHRLEEWNEREGWQKKILKPYFEENSKYQNYAGLSGNTHLLGRALSLRNSKDSIYKTNRELYGHLGPYLPIIFEACQEDELAQETKIGSVSHGIFTYYFARVLREAKSSGFVPTLAQINEQTVKLVSGKFKYQNPRLVGPSDKLNQAFSWQVRKK